MTVRIALTACFVLMIGLIEEKLVGAQDIERLKSGVVRITASEGNKTKVGSGFIVKLDSEIAYIVTAAHVVSGDPQPRVQFFSRQEGQVRATVKHAEGSDEATGMALLTVQGKENIPAGLAALPLATTAGLSGSEDIIVIGHPRGAGDWAIIKGSIASRQGRYVTIDANIDEGNSGGPILHNSQVVGLIGGTQRYGKGVTSGTMREYLEGHGMRIQEPAIEGIATRETQPVNTTKPEPPETLGKITGKDGAPMVLIPAGEFWLGSADGEGEKDEHPLHRVYLDAFYIDQYEVTMSRYTTFFQKTNRSVPGHWSLENLKKHGNKPVNGVDWNDAVAYCSWAGKRLPTEAEWEKAARGTDGRRYPWGDELPDQKRANFAQDPNSRDGHVLVDVGSYEKGKSPYDVYDMAGNVWEWVADRYDKDYYSKSSERNPGGPSTLNAFFNLHDDRVVRGGSWDPAPVLVRSALRLRLPPSTRLVTLGFRCAQDVPK